VIFLGSSVKSVWEKATMQGGALSRRSADGGGDRLRDAHRRWPRRRSPAARADRAALARRSSDQRGARAPGERPRPLPRRHPRSTWEGRQAPFVAVARE